MDFFFHQPEVLSTINVILGPRLGSWPAVLVFGAGFILLAISGYFLALKFSWRRTTVLFVMAALAWLPLFTQFVYSSVAEFNDTWFTLNLPEREQTIWRFCRIDKYQNLGGGFCGLYPFIESVRELVPKNSKVTYLTLNLGPYLTNYLYGDYQLLVEPEQADYLLIFRPITIDQALEKTIKEQFTVVAAFAPDQLILKRR